MNYIRTIKKILDYGIGQKGISTAGEGDIYEINSMPAESYPIFWVASTSPHVEKTNYITYNLTLYYIDRQLADSDVKNCPDTTQISSAGISILSNVIKKLRNDPEVLSVNDDVQYTVWTDTQIFADKCAGVYANISISMPHENICIA